MLHSIGHTILTDFRYHSYDYCKHVYAYREIFGSEYNGLGTPVIYTYTRSDYNSTDRSAMIDPRAEAPAV